MLKRFLFFIHYPIIRFLFPTRTVGKKNLKNLKGATIVASNHLANVDAILLSMIMIKYNFYYLAKKELEPKNKIAHWFFNLMNFIYVDRKAVGIKAIKEVTSVLKNGNKIMIFPEGTRNHGNEDNMLEMKGGVVFFASHSDATIVPVQIIKKPRLFRFNTVVIGEPYKLKETTKEGLENEKIILEEKLKAIRVDYENKHNKKSNKEEKV